mmetsp:Transcript_693/g.2336  ORF Transcript_693/g.2336 Transcript_693/m.2336 type:complete len:311 (+) Transcript_693:89-1021(+)
MLTRKTQTREAPGRTEARGSATRPSARGGARRECRSCPRAAPRSRLAGERPPDHLFGRSLSTDARFHRELGVSSRLHSRLTRCHSPQSAPLSPAVAPSAPPPPLAPTRVSRAPGFAFPTAATIAARRGFPRFSANRRLFLPCVSAFCAKTTPLATTARRDARFPHQEALPNLALRRRPPGADARSRRDATTFLTSTSTSPLKPFVFLFRPVQRTNTLPPKPSLPRTAQLLVFPSPARLRSGSPRAPWRAKARRENRPRRHPTRRARVARLLSRLALVPVSRTQYPVAAPRVAPSHPPPRARVPSPPPSRR